MLRTRVSTHAQNQMLRAIAFEANGGYLRIYDGTQPESADVFPDGNLLSELRFNQMAFGLPNMGKIQSNGVLVDNDAKGSGKAEWFRVFKSDASTALWDGSVGESGANLNLDNVQIESHAIVRVTALTLALAV